MSTTPEINIIHTPCKKCVFAQYDNKTQTSCALNYLDIYTKNNVEILSAYDEELEFYVINNKKCIGYRENSWFVQFGLENSTITDKLNKFYSLNHIDYFIVINLDDTAPDEHRVNKLCDEIKSLQYKPQKIIFVRYRKNALVYSYSFVVKFLDSCDLSKCPWQIKTMEDDNANYEDTLHNIVTLNKAPRFVLSIKLQDSYSISKILQKGNEVVYKNLDRFTVISNENKENYLFSGLLYRFALLSENKNILKDTENYIIV